ncbi:type VI secretion system contractile sheath large subunit [Reyranella sp.]|jgi:type VI secretion system protein ImpD/type VI secretion system protein ImpC|uniref:type VI secretion system contractile sheath large subunit n=1 Tax=Reyranella sp. TaxID=1929291 RepID=UPI002F928752
MGDEATIAEPAAKAAQQSAPAAQQSRSLRDSVLAGQFFGDRHAGVAAELATFLHGGLGTADGLRTWFGEALPDLLATGSLRAALDRDIAEIDTALSDQLDAVLHAPRFLALEGRWRGLAWLVSGIEPGRRIKVRLLPVSWSELCRDLERALEFDQSLTFRRIYEDEFGMPGGEPYGLMVIDHALRHRVAPGATTDDVGALVQLSAVAAAAFMPVVLSLDPRVLEVDGFADLEGVRDVTAALRGPDHVRWRSLAGRADMRFVAVTLPRLLARPPWADDPSRVDRFRYREYAPDPGTRVWMSAAYAFAACAVRAFADNNWPADVRGVEIDRIGGGLVTDLDAEPFVSGPPRAWPRQAVEYQFGHRQEHALVEVGLMPVGVLPFGPDLVFGSSRSMQAPASYSGVSAAAAEANARLSAQINSMLCASRFAHLLKVMGRDMVGTFRTADEIERQLNRWLQDYVNTNVNSTSDSRARFPLVEGAVRVFERPGKPGVFGCTMHLRPHYQLDDIATAFHLVTELAAPAG